MNGLQLAEEGERVRFRVRVQPRAARNEVVGVVEGVLRLRLAAPPVEGAANEACCRLLADCLGVAPSRVRITGGRTARQKAVEVEGLPAEEVRRRLSACLAGQRK